MAYSANQLPSGLDTLDNSTITTSDLAVVGDASDSGRVKAITLANLETKVASDLNLSGTNTGDQTITLSGDASGSGTSGITVTVAQLPATRIGNGIISDAEYYYLDGLSSTIQTQLDSKLSANQAITLSGDINGFGTTSINATLSTVNSNVGTFGNSNIPVLTVNAKGLVTAVSTTPVAISLTASGVTGTLPIAHGGTGTIILTIPASGDIVGRTDQQTLTNKTLQAAIPTTSFTPSVDDGLALGTNLKGFSDLFLASGGQISWAAGDVTLTHGSGKITMVGTGGFVAPSVSVSGSGIFLKDSSDSFYHNIYVADTASAARTFLLNLNNTNHVLTMTSGNLTVGSTSSISGTAYVVGGTDIPLADGGTGASLTDPNADRIMFWDDSAGAVTWLTAGSGLTITDTTITATAGAGTGLTWVEATTSTTAVANRGYIINSASRVTITMPATSTSGDIVRIVGKGAGGWLVGLNASQQVNFGNLSTTVGINGSLASTHRYDSAELLSISTTYDWNVISSQGNISIN